MKFNNKSKIRILIVDDEPAICEVLAAAFLDEGYQVQVARDGESGLTAINEFRPDIVFLDIWMPGSLDGLDVLNMSKSKKNCPEFVVMSGHGTIETAVKAVRFGAWDFVEKPLSLDKICIVIENILTYLTEYKAKLALLSKLRSNMAMVGEGPIMKSIKTKVSSVSNSSSWIFIEGAKGTGKHLLAQNLHYLSARAGRPFIAINCPSIPPDLIEAELFGSVDNSPTNSTHNSKGKIELSDGGTLVLEETDCLPEGVQLRLLKLLKEGRIRPVNSVNEVTVDVRVIFSSSKSFQKNLCETKFNQELYDRLQSNLFKLPILMDRREDIPMLISHFSRSVEQQSGFETKQFSATALEKLMSYSWPGNVLELRNFVERIYILSDSILIDPLDLKFAGLEPESHVDFVNHSLDFRQARAQFEKDFLLQKINENSGNISRTAELIGLERSYLYRKIKHYNMDV